MFCIDCSNILDLIWWRPVNHSASALSDIPLLAQLNVWLEHAYVCSEYDVNAASRAAADFTDECCTCNSLQALWHIVPHP